MKRRAFLGVFAALLGFIGFRKAKAAATPVPCTRAELLSRFQKDISFVADAEGYVEKHQLVDLRPPAKQNLPDDLHAAEQLIDPVEPGFKRVLVTHRHDRLIELALVVIDSSNPRRR